MDYDFIFLMVYSEMQIFLILEIKNVCQFYLIYQRYHVFGMMKCSGNIPWLSRFIGLKVMENNVTEGHQDNTHTNNVSKDKTIPYGVYFYGKKWGLPYIFRMVQIESVST